MQLAVNASRCAGKGRPSITGLPDALRKEAAPAAGRVLRKVLAVDDERDLADLAEALLCGHGLEARAAYSAMEALRILEDDPEIDAVFTDVMMPGMNGLQLAETVRSMFSAISIVLTSGFIPPALMERHGRPYLYVGKPYSIETVIRLLQSGQAPPARG
ncbi:MAG TPA: response regulator [Massilia sp.]|nr:response regulator [Massilia sp.]